jgi:hypothetical protein
VVATRLIPVGLNPPVLIPAVLNPLPTKLAPMSALASLFNPEPMLPGIDE